MKESDIAGEDGRTKGGEGQDVLKRAIKQDVCLARYPLRRTSSHYYIVTTEQVRRATYWQLRAPARNMATSMPLYANHGFAGVLVGMQEY